MVDKSLPVPGSRIWSLPSSTLNTKKTTSDKLYKKPGWCENIANKQKSYETIPFFKKKKEKNTIILSR